MCIYVYQIQVSELVSNPRPENKQQNTKTRIKTKIKMAEMFILIILVVNLSTKVVIPWCNIHHSHGAWTCALNTIFAMCSIFCCLSFASEDNVQLRAVMPSMQPTTSTLETDPVSSVLSIPNDSKYENTRIKR